MKSYRTRVSSTSMNCPDVLPFLYGSRYCDTQRLTDQAWWLFGNIAGGWQRVQAVCDYVHDHIKFGYHYARCDRTASEGYAEQIGVCRDFAHLAITLCRCMNIPARYCTGYLGDIGVPRDPAPMDFSAWFEVYLDGRWLSFDARHNQRRIGRIVIARGRDAADTAISTQFGNASLARFKIKKPPLGSGGARKRRRDAVPFRVKPAPWHRKALGSRERHANGSGSWPAAAGSWRRRRPAGRRP
jgi:transglutaminase-like putative cysteine protease